MRKKKYYIGKARRGRKRRDYPRFFIRHAEIISLRGNRRGIFTETVFYVNPSPETITLPQPEPSKVVSLQDYRQRKKIESAYTVLIDDEWDENEFRQYVREEIDEDTLTWRLEAEEIIYRWQLRKKKRWTRLKPILILDDGYPFIALIDKHTGKRAPLSLLRFNNDVLRCKQVDEAILSREIDEFDFDPELPPSG